MAMYWWLRLTLHLDPKTLLYLERGFFAYEPRGDFLKTAGSAIPVLAKGTQKRTEFVNKFETPARIN